MNFIDRPAVTRSWRTVICLAAGGMLLLALLRGLPPEAFFSGDSGAKLTAVKSAIAHPSRPFDVAVPVIAGVPAPDLLSPFFLQHGDHAHAATSQVFPLMSAVPFALIGPHGLYIIPAAAWLLACWLTARISQAAHANGVWSVVAIVVSTPLLFYGLEFWEHMPAATLTAAATLCAMRHEEGRLWLASGLLTGAAFLLRPEAVWYGLAVIALSAHKTLYRRTAAWALGFALAILPLVTYNLLHFRNPAGPHLAMNAAASMNDWASTRLLVAEVWFLRGTGVALPMLLVGGLLTSLAPHAAQWRRRQVAIVGATVVIIATVYMTAMAALRVYPRESLWASFPLAGLIALPFRPAASDANHLQFLRRVALAFITLAWLTAPHAGGAQWGPRFLLPACVPLAILIGSLAHGVAREPRWRALAFPAIVGLIAAQLWIQRSAYRDLRAAKRIYAQVVDAIGQHAVPSLYVLSDIWWLDLIAAHHRPPLTFLYAESQAKARAAVDRLRAAGERRYLVVRSAEEAPAGATQRWFRGTCYRVEQSRFLAIRGMSLLSVACAAPQKSEAATP